MKSTEVELLQWGKIGGFVFFVKFLIIHEEWKFIPKFSLWRQRIQKVIVPLVYTKERRSITSGLFGVRHLSLEPHTRTIRDKQTMDTNQQMEIRLHDGRSIQPSKDNLLLNTIRPPMQVPTRRQLTLHNRRQRHTHHPNGQWQNGKILLGHNER